MVSTNGSACTQTLITGDNFVSTLNELSLDSAPGCELGPSCFESPPPTLIPDTTYLSIPVLTGGQWHYFNLENILIPLMDSTQITIEGTEYLLIIEPGSDFYGPGEIDFTIFEINSSGENIPPTTKVELEIQYVLEYTYELVEYITYEIIPDGEVACLNTTIGPGSFDDIPLGPENPCDPITLSFGPESYVEYEYGILNCIQYDINIEVCPGEILTFDSAGEFTYSCIDENGCPFEKIVSIVDDFDEPYVENVSYECDPGGETYTAEIQIYNSFFTNVYIQGLGDFDASGSVTISEIPNCVVFTGYATNFDNGCWTSFEIYHCCECTNTQSSIAAEFCDGESFDILDQSFTQPGEYEVLTTNSAGCDSLISLSLEVLPAIFNYMEEQICEGTEFIFYDQILTESGEYTHVEINDNGCQEQYTLQLEVFQTDDVYDSGTLNCQQQEIDIETCPGEIVTFFDPGEYTYTCIDANGCEFEKIVLIISDELNPYVEDIYYECDPGNETYTAHIVVSDPYTVIVIPELGTNIYDNVTVPNCTSLNGYVYNPDNGCETDFTLYHCCECTNPTQSSIDAVICEGESFEIFDQSFSQSGNYEILTTNSAGCDSLISLSLELLPVIFNYMEEQICDGAEFIFYDQFLTESGEYTHVEINDNGCQEQYTLYLEVLSTEDVQLIESICEGADFVFYNQILTESGEYTHYETNDNGCQEQYTLLLEVFKTDDVQLIESICEGETYDFFEQEIGEPGTYTYDQVDPIGCLYKVILQLEVSPIPEYFESISICEGGSIEIGGESISTVGTFSVLDYDNTLCGEMYTYDVSMLESSFSSESITLCKGESLPLSNSTIYTEGIYTNTLTNAYGCDSIIQIDVRIDSIDFEMITIPSCLDMENGSIQIASIQDGTAPFTFSVNGDFTNEDIFEDLSVGSYTVQVMDQNSCEHTKQITIEEIPEIMAEIQDAYELTCEEPTLNLALNVDESTEVVWSTGNFGKELFIDEVGVYSVTLSNSCQDKMIEFLVEEAENDNPDLVYIPNAFSPNQDEINDEFKIYPTTPPIDFQLEIYDRWGNKVFHTDDPDIGWTGVYRNERMLPGVYVYKLEAVINSCIGSPKLISKKGDVTLIK